MTTSRTDGFRTLQVADTWQLTPRMKRLRLTGENLEHFASSDDIHVRLYIPEDGEKDIRSLVFHADGQPRDTGPGSGFAVRYYTIRRIDRAAGWLDRLSEPVNAATIRPAISAACQAHAAST